MFSSKRQFQDFIFIILKGLLIEVLHSTVRQNVRNYHANSGDEDLGTLARRASSMESIAPRNVSQSQSTPGSTRVVLNVLSIDELSSISSEIDMYGNLGVLSDIQMLKSRNMSETSSLVSTIYMNDGDNFRVCRIYQKKASSHFPWIYFNRPRE